MSTVCAGPLGAVRPLDLPSWLMAAPDRIRCGVSVPAASSDAAALLQPWRTSRPITSSARSHGSAKNTAIAVV